MEEKLEALKSVLGINGTDKDAVLSFLLDDVEETIKNYCNVVEVPDGLFHTSIRMAVDLYRNENLGHEESALGAVSSISEGDTSTSFQKSVDENFKDTILKDYQKTLNRYRKVVF